MGSSQDGSVYGTYGQRYDNMGATAGSEFQVNTYTTSAQEFPSVAIDSYGDFVIAWQSGGQDGSGNGIYGQRYTIDGIDIGSFTSGTAQSCLDANTTFQTVVLNTPYCDKNGNATYSVAVTPSGQGVTCAAVGTGANDCGFTLDITTTAGATAGNYTITFTITEPNGVTNDSGLTPIFSNATTVIFDLGVFEVLNDVDVQSLLGGSINPGSTGNFNVNIVNTDEGTTYDWMVAGTSLSQMMGDGDNTGAAVPIIIAGSGGNTIEASATTINVATSVTKSILTVLNPADGTTATFSASLLATNPCGNDTGTFTDAFTALPRRIEIFPRLCRRRKRHPRMGNYVGSE